MKCSKLTNLMLFLSIALSCGVSAYAQGLIVHKTDGTQIEIPYEELDSITTYQATDSNQPTNPDAEIQSAKEVDLGLSVIWAGWNVGATSPEEYGGYYAWGEVNEKECYNNSTYEYFLYGPYYKDIGAEISGTVYDAARQKWGETWRMPTYSELNELIEKCTWTWIKYKEIEGYKVTGPNGRSIFLPATGYKQDYNLVDSGTIGHYRSGTRSSEETLYAWHLTFNINRADNPYPTFQDYGRRWGYSIRPVKNK